MVHPQHKELDEKEIAFILRLKEGVKAIYRVGSRMDDTHRPDSDMDYLVLLDWDKHYPSSNKLFGLALDDRWDIYCEKIFFTKKDLQEPSTMKGIEMKLIFLFGRNRGRELLWGQDVFDQWLSPSIDNLFEQYGINEGSVRRFQGGYKAQKS